ncbi:hypothetical protein CLU79DRAFT_774194 [Phycomyces nitens]|nr:hypothetical protein CLU79DRAFT_774194 [Phycomyces nitens]
MPNLAPPPPPQNETPTSSPPLDQSAHSVAPKDSFTMSPDSLKPTNSTTDVTLQPNPNLSRPNQPKRQFMNKFATIPTDKSPQNLCRDLLLSNFDRNLTVEKAHFEPQPFTGTANGVIMAPTPQPSYSNSSHSSIPDLHDKAAIDQANPGDPKNRRIPMTTACQIPPHQQPLLTTPGSSGQPQSSGQPNNQSTLSIPPFVSNQQSDSRRASKGENDRLLRSCPSLNKRKKRSMASLGGTASPAEVFHRNLVDAVSNVEDSDENEQYVYPFSDNGSLHRPHSIQSIPGNTPELPSDRPRRGGRQKGFFGDLFRTSLSNQASRLAEEEEEEEEGMTDHYRPRMRNHVMDHPHRPTKKDQSKPGLLGRWYDGKPANRRSRRSHQSMVAHGPYGDGYTSDDEGMPLLRVDRYRTRQKKNCSQVVWNTCLGVLAIILLALVLVIYRAKPLEDIEVEMGRVLASDKELIFDLHVKASNWNWWTVKIGEADISMFGFSQIVPLSLNQTKNYIEAQGADPAEYLGSFYHFDEPLSIPSSMFTKQRSITISQIRIKSPGADKSGNERWSRIIRYPYGLVARGVFKYHPTPLPGTYPQSIAICDVAQVDPMTGNVSEDPDQSYCLGD